MHECTENINNMTTIHSIVTSELVKVMCDTTFKRSTS